MNNYFNEKEVKVNDLDIEYSIVNRKNGAYDVKAPIIFLPGFGTDSTNHQNFAKLLSRYDYFAINGPAQGNSPWFNVKDLTLQKYADLVKEFILRNDLERIILIGHGSSCAVVSLLNSMVNDRILANVLVSPIDNSFQNDAEQVKDVLIPRIPENIVQLFRLTIFNYDIKALNSIAWKDYENYRLSYFIKNYDALSLQLDTLLSDSIKKSIETLYSSINKPTLLIFGDSDGLLRVNDVANNIHNLINNSQVSIIPLAGNEPYLDNINNYYSNVITFIDYIYEQYEKQLFLKEMNE